ncbi:hypothetical protein MMC25_002245 [Agyrium rufum]|nr:hypothetical protein [Agyrium rufum]
MAFSTTPKSPMSSLPSPAHQHKRLFQPSITSFFATSTLPSAAQPLPPPPSHALPSEIQSSLLNLGMRIRKAVPEGYKTYKTLGDWQGGGGGWGEKRSPSFQSISGRNIYLDSKSGDDYANQLYHSTGSRELTPYYAIHRVGNLDRAAAEEYIFQPPSRNIPDEEELPDLLFAEKNVEDEDDWTPFSSQESEATRRSAIVSNAGQHSLPLRGKSKRVWEDEDDQREDYDGTGLSGAAAVDSPNNPSSWRDTTRSLVPSRSLRPIAQARTRRKASRENTVSVQKAPSVTVSGRMNLGSIEPYAQEDFEEMDFFREDDWKTERMEF